MSQLNDLAKRIGSLPCPSGHKAIFGRGSNDASLALVGESPSRADERYGQPFSGDVGDCLAALLGQFAVSLNDVWITYAIKCRTLRPLHGRQYDRPPTIAEIDQWRPLLLEELRDLDPKVILCLGKTAARAILGKDVTIRETHGKAISQPGIAATIIVTYHPSYLLCQRGGPHIEALEAFLQDLDLVIQLSGMAEKKTLKSKPAA